MSKILGDLRGPIKVLVIDDSSFIRHALRRMLNSDPDIQVVGLARDGDEAMRMIAASRPDVITLDVRMPHRDGLEVLRAIMATHPTPTLMVSSLTSAGSVTTLAALEAGAVDFIDKSRCHMMMDIQILAETLISKVKAAAGVDVARLIVPPNAPLQLRSAPRVATSERASERAHHLVILGASTGGPVALQGVLSQLPKNFPASILVVQHMPSGFTESFAERLNDTCAIDIAEAHEGDRLLRGRALVAPSGYQTLLYRRRRGVRIVLTRDAMGETHLPSLNVVIASAAQSWNSRAIVVIMTGMGRDGAGALPAAAERGFSVIAQSPETCVIKGMPQAAILTGCIQRVVPLEGIAKALTAFVEE